MNPLSKYFLLLASLLLLHIKAYNQKPDFALSIQCSEDELLENLNTNCKYGYLLSYGPNTIGTIDLPYLRCANGPDSFNIIFEKTLGNQSYIIIEYRHKSRGCHWRERGSCGAGEEFGLIWVSINKTTCSIIESKSFLYVSCTYNKYCRTDQPINLMFENNKIDFIILRCMDKLRFFNKKRPELGFF